MTDIAISVDNLSKKYRIGQAQQRHDTLRDALVAGLQAPFRRRHRNGAGPEDDTIWALKDVSFEVKRGEVVGIIGRNGAGKSTLLKILSQITEPTSGRAVINGRVGSLLEVGTGFHDELTGRENIYLSGAILGMRREEIDRKFDEIVDFSGVEKFIDTPVKRYSSGMKVRLGFAVAAHLDPEILLIDEVLAVGDAAFRKKCLGKMGDLAKEDRTVLFVSHNMAAVDHLCNWAIRLEDGLVVDCGDPKRVIASYANRIAFQDGSWHVDQRMLQSSGPARITNLEFLDVNANSLRRFQTGDGFTLRIHYELEDGMQIPAASFVVRIKSQFGGELFRFSNTPISGFPIFDLMGTGYVDLLIPMMPVTEAMYSFDIGLAQQGARFLVEHLDVASLVVEGRDVYGSGVALEQSRGMCVLTHKWKIQPSNEPQSESRLLGEGLLMLLEHQK